jgi:subtilase family serine protease
MGNDRVSPVPPVRNEAHVFQGSCMKRKMAHKESYGLPLAVLLLASLAVTGPVSAVAQSAASRLAGDWRSTEAVTILASRPPLSPSATDIGAAPSGARLERMLLLLEPSADQRQALAAELANQQNPASPEYHHWLTPADFAGTYANSATDVAAVVAWLQSQGLQVAPLPAGRGWIEFSGTVAQVEQAFLAQVDSVTTAAGTRPVLAGTVSVPAALAPLVHGLVSLDGAVSTPALTTPRPMTSSAAELAAETSLSKAEALTPQLVAQLLRLDALQAAGVNGAGETIAIAARSNVNSADVAAFRTAFGLPASALLVNPNGSDPGLTGDQAEATLAASWAGAAAPGAQIALVPAATTSATDGLDLSLAAIVDQAPAHTVAVGYSACEASLSEAHQAFYAALYRQAAAEGIAVIAATGDSGPAACHAAGSDAPVSAGYGVNALASTPWNTAVGVAAFGVSGPAAGTSALAAWSPASTADPAYASGGGGSTLYSAPSWQPVPAQPVTASAGAASHYRLLPDVSLPVAVDSSVNPGLAFCMSDSAASSGCTLVRGGGSSAAAAIFAGVAALVAEQYGAQGNLAPNLFALSGVSGIFEDVQQGSAQLRCTAASPGCGATEKIGFHAGAGYDLATGLGSVNAQALVSQWKARPELGIGATNVSLAVTPTEPNSTYNPSALLTLTATVIPMTVGATPGGTVTFINSSNSAALAGASTVALNSSGTASMSLALNNAFSTTGSYNLGVQYNGDTNYYGPVASQPVTVTTEKSSIVLTVVPSTSSSTPGATIPVTANFAVSSTNGPPAGSLSPAGLVTLNVNGTPTYTTQAGAANGITSATFSVVVPSGTLTSLSLQAVYAGDANYSASTSSQVTITVAKNPTTLVITPATLTPTAGTSLLVTAAITATGSGSIQPTGTVTFTLDGVSQPAATVTAGSPSTASITLPPISAGSHTLVGAYSGDSNFASSTSSTVTLVAAKGATVTTVTASPAVLAAGVTETLTAAIAPLNAVTGTLTGTVSFYDGGATLLGTATVSSNTATLTGVTLANSVSHSITAIYSGDTNWLTSTSAALIMAATTLPDHVVLTSNLSTVAPGQTVILTATVTPNTPPPTGAEQNPTGNVVFYDGSIALGEVALAATPLSDSSTATLTPQTLPGGQDTLTAFYVGDLTYNPATSNALTLDVQNFTITPSPANPATNLNIVKGSAGSASFIIGGLGGFNNEIQVVCAVIPQDDMTCTATPQQVVPTATVTFVVQTFTTGGPYSTTTARDRHEPPWPRAAGGSALALLAFFLLPFGRRARIFAGRSTRRFLVLILLLAGLGGAGIGCNSVSTPLNAHGTPLGVATLTITASAYVDNTVVSRSVYLTVNVVTPGSTTP